MTEADRPARVLLVEDNEMDVELTLDALELTRPDVVIDVARSGREALDRLLGRPSDDDGPAPELPDLILLDLKMPGIDGHEVVRQIKQSPVNRRIPLVILTSSREDGDRALAYDAGANSYLVKPVSFEVFLRVVDRLLDYWLALNVRPPEPPPRTGEPGGPRAP